MEGAHRVLVVDDLQEITQFFAALARRMAPHGVEVETETDPRKALERIRSNGYALVVSDFRMREVDGLDVLKAAGEANPRGHRILMTGYNEIPAPMARIQEAQVDAYVQKPLRAQDLMLLILDFVHGNESTIAACRAKAREIELLGEREERPAL